MRSPWRQRDTNGDHMQNKRILRGRHKVAMAIESANGEIGHASYKWSQQIRTPQNNKIKFSQFLSILVLGTLYQPPSRLFIAKDGIRGHGSSPRQVGYFTPKLFGGPGEPESRKPPKMTLLPLPLGIFASLTKMSNDLVPCAEVGVKQHLSVSENQKHQWMVVPG